MSPFDDHESPYGRGECNDKEFVMPQPAFNTKTWMSHILDVGRLKLTDIVWPGSHNCGMDKKAPGYDPVLGNWTACQNDSFAAQLANGARALDIRLGFNSGTTASAFYFHHNGFKFNRTFNELIDAVNAFLDQNPDEFILLDFHHLGDGDKSFDYARFHDVLIQGLGQRLIASTQAPLTVQQLKQASSKRRVIAAVPARRELDDDIYWPRIPHKWQGSSFPNPEDLSRHITTQLAKAPYSFLWSLSVTGYTPLFGPSHLEDQINQWFHASLGLINRCSIINIDFFEESQIVRNCWVACSENAVHGTSLFEPA